MATSDAKAPALTAIRAEIVTRRRFLISSHARPDGDSIGSQLAMASALRTLGKDVRIVNHDLAPAFLLAFPGAKDIEIADHVEGDYDAAIVLECGDLSRTGVSGLEPYFIINIDHHPGNTAYGAINWFDEGAAACGEMVFDVIEALGVPLSQTIAANIYLTILADTGGFHYSGISARTFDICRRALDAGVQPVPLARALFDNNSLGRLKLVGLVLSEMKLDPSGRLAILHLDSDMAASVGATSDDTDALVNMPLTVGDIEAVAFFKEIDAHHHRVSLRSKGDVDVGQVARQFGGGGHKNAAGCTLMGSYDKVRVLIVEGALKAIGQSRIA
jgi:bifunctional oligoribonuclease and PAP phosphatase NrnA